MIPLTVAQIVKASGALLRLALRFWQVGLLAPSWLEPSRVGNSFRWINSCVYPLQCRTDSYPKVGTRGCHGTKHHTIDGDWHKSTPVLSALLLDVRPSAIFWRVTKVWIDSVNAVAALRSFPHVFEKSIKRLTPAVANLYAAPAPIREIFAFLVVAPSLHRYPCLVLNGSARSALVPVLCDRLRPSLYEISVSPHLGSPFFCGAPAGRDASASQVWSGREVNCSAITQALPHTRSVIFSDNEKTTELHARHVNKFHGCILRGCHDI